MSKIISIGQAAKLLGVHVQTLRNWEKSGKLKPDSISPGGTRRYNLDSVIARLDCPRNCSLNCRDFSFFLL